MRAMHIVTALAFVAAAFLTASTWSSAEAGDPKPAAEQNVEHGRELFRTYCASCHGLRGGGDGALAEVLKTPPANLTQLRNKNGGEFPKPKLEKIIDGRDGTLVKVHGVTDMPVWGERLALEVPGSMGQKNAHVKRRIGFILRYLESIQAPAPTPVSAPAAK